MVLPAMTLHKDLLVDMEPFFESVPHVKPWLMTEGQASTRERLQSPEQRQRFDDAIRCILCAACTSARCSGSTTGTSDWLPWSMLIASSSTAGTPAQTSGWRYCPAVRALTAASTTSNCTEACPRGIKVTKAIVEIRRETLWRRS